MKDSLWSLAALMGYSLFFTGSVVGASIWITKRKQEKPPLEQKLLRGPGESLRKRMQKFEEDIVFMLGLAALVPISCGTVVLGVLIWLTPTMPMYQALCLITAAALPSTFFSARWCVRRFLRKQLVGAITQDSSAVLTESEIDLITRKLDTLCRDVKD